MRGYSTAIGSFTFMIISARAHTSSTGRSSAPTDEYCSSSKPLPSPPPCSTSTVWPASTTASAPAGPGAMRSSLVLISFGTPMILVGFAFAVEEAGPAERRERARTIYTPAPVWRVSKQKPPHAEDHEETERTQFVLCVLSVPPRLCVKRPSAVTRSLPPPPERQPP